MPAPMNFSKGDKERGRQLYEKSPRLGHSHFVTFTSTTAQVAKTNKIVGCEW